MMTAKQREKIRDREYTILLARADKMQKQRDNLLAALELALNWTSYQKGGSMETYKQQMKEIHQAIATTGGDT